MTAEMLGWFIAGICFTALIILWFSISFRELSQKRRVLNAISEQVAMHRMLCMQERGGENDSSAQNILAAKLVACEQAEKEYKTLLRNPIYRIPAYILGLESIRKK